MTAHECLDCHHEWADDDPDDPVNARKITDQEETA